MPGASKPRNIETMCIDVRAGSLAKLELGLYPDRTQVPEFQFDFVPDLPDAIGVHRAIMDMGSGVLVTYHFQNYSQQTVTVLPANRDRANRLGAAA